MPRSAGSTSSTALALVGAYLLCRWITRRRAGKVLVAIRDSETRVLFSGYSPAALQALRLRRVGGAGGLAGALYVPQVGIITPAKIGVLPSIEMVVWVAAGGRGTLVGAMVGAFGVNWMQSWLTTSYPDLWLLFLGALFMGVVLFFPDGVVGARAAPVGRLAPRRRGRGWRRRQDLAGTRAPRTGDAVSGRRRHGSIIYLEDVTVDYDGFKALERLNFYMDRRELRVVIGPNGAGKTTLLDVISGTRASRRTGRVIFGHHTDLLGLRENEIAALGDRPQVPDAVGLREPHACGRTSSCRCAGASKGVFATLLDARRGRRARCASSRRWRRSGSPARRGALAGALSHGEKQWLEIGMVHRAGARAAAGRRAGGRHDRRGDGADGRAAQAIAADRSVLVIEHDMAFVRQIARTVTVLHEGAVLCEGPVEEVQARPARARGLPRPAARARRRDARTVERASARRLRRSQVLWGVDLEVPAGQVVCLMGRNGVGKTTLLKTVMGLLPAAAGA